VQFSQFFALWVKTKSLLGKELGPGSGIDPLTCTFDGCSFSHYFALGVKNKSLQDKDLEPRSGIKPLTCTLRAQVFGLNVDFAYYILLKRCFSQLSDTIKRLHVNSSELISHLIAHKYKRIKT
jgi:hypothetical protein